MKTKPEQDKATAKRFKSEVSKIANNKFLPLVDRIMCRVRKESNGCWIWTGRVGGRVGDFRPLMKYGGSDNALVYRLMFKIYKGEIPTGHFVCHHCDNPRCVNPDHLFKGTVQDNVNDSIAKGRFTHQIHPGLNTERARQLGLRNTWCLGRKYPNRKLPMKRLHLCALIAFSRPAILAELRKEQP